MQGCEREKKETVNIFKRPWLETPDVLSPTLAAAAFLLRLPPALPHTIQIHQATQLVPVNINDNFRGGKTKPAHNVQMQTLKRYGG